LPKRVSEIQKKQISESFINGKNISEISEAYNFSKQTIKKQLKSMLGEEQFNTISEKREINLGLKNDNAVKDIFNKIEEEAQNSTQPKEIKHICSEKELIDKEFFEIPPFITHIDLNNQKDLSSRPLSEANFPDVVFMVVDKNIELEPKLLKDFPEWNFLSEDDLNRKTIQVFSDQKLAKQSCSKNQRLIKVPNTNVFLIAADNLKSKGISRIIFGDSLLAL